MPKNGHGGDGALVRVRVWDLPVRLVHWAVVILFALSWWTGDNSDMELHRYSGYGILALVLFRIFWGFAGSTTARFATFVRSPSVFFGYLKRLFEKPGEIVAGHNPMGGWSVVALLSLLLLQCVLGLFTVDVDGIESGPLADLVSFETGRAIARLHGKVFDLLLIFAGLHLAAILFYRLYKRENLIAAMVTGFKRLPYGASGELRFAGIRRAVLWLVVAVVIVVGLATRFQF